jgi:hypothetical protein
MAIIEPEHQRVDHDEGKKAPDHALEHAQGHRRHRRPRDIAQPADDDDGEGLEHEAEAHQGMHGVDGCESGPGQSGQPDADGHGQPRHRARVDAHHQGGVAILRDSPHGPPMRVP